MSLSLVLDSLELLDAGSTAHLASRTESQSLRTTSKRRKLSHSSRKSIFHGKQIKCVVDEYKEKLEEESKDRTKESIKILKKIDSTCSASHYYKQALAQHRKVLDERHRTKSSKKKENRSVFTEADFKRMNQVICYSRKKKTL